MLVKANMVAILFPCPWICWLTQYAMISRHLSITICKSIRRFINIKTHKRLGVPPVNIITKGYNMFHLHGFQGSQAEQRELHIRFEWWCKGSLISLMYQTTPFWEIITYKHFGLLEMPTNYIVTYISQIS